MPGTSLAEQIGQEIRRVVGSPFPVAMQVLVALLEQDENGLALATVANLDPCGIRKLASIVLEEVQSRPAAFAVLTRLTTSRAYCRALIEGHPEFVDSLIRSALGEDFSKVWVPAGRLLAHTGSQDPPLPADTPKFLAKTFSSTFEDPSLESLWLLYELLMATCGAFVTTFDGELQKLIIGQLEAMLKAQSGSSDQHKTLLCLGIMQQLSNYGDDFLKARAYFSGSKVEMTVKLVGLQAVIHGRDQSLSPLEAAKLLDISSTILRGIDSSFLFTWASSNLGKKITAKLSSIANERGQSPVIRWRVLDVISILTSRETIPEAAQQAFSALLDDPSRLLPEDCFHHVRLDRCLTAFGRFIEHSHVEGIVHAVLQLGNAVSMDHSQLLAAQHLSLLCRAMLPMLEADPHLRHLFIQQLQHLLRVGSVDDAIPGLRYPQVYCSASICSNEERRVQGDLKIGLIKAFIASLVSGGTDQISLPPNTTLQLLNKLQALSTPTKPCVPSNEDRAARTLPFQHPLVPCTPATVDGREPWRDQVKALIVAEAAHRETTLVHFISSLCHDLEERCQNVEEPLMRETERLAQLQQMYSKLQTQHSALQSEHAALQRDHAEIREVCSVVRQEHSVLQKEHLELQTTLDERAIRIGSIEVRKAELQQAIEGNLEDLDHYRSQIATLKNQVQEANKKHIKATREVELLREGHEEALEKLITSKNELGCVLQQRCHELGDARRDHKIELLALEQRLTDQQAHSEEQLQRMHEAVSSLEEQLQALASENAAKDGQNADLESELDELLETLEARENELAHLQKLQETVTRLMGGQPEAVQTGLRRRRGVRHTFVTRPARQTPDLDMSSPVSRPLLEPSDAAACSSHSSSFSQKEEPTPKRPRRQPRPFRVPILHAARASLSKRTPRKTPARRDPLGDVSMGRGNLSPRREDQATSGSLKAGFAEQDGAV